jgi:biopolymer transport protein ExbD
MAELQQSPQQNGRQRKRSSRVDMTAMVDVAFLLLTFFILTTSLSQPKSLTVNKPPVHSPVDILCDKMMTLYLQKDQIVTITGCDQQLATVPYGAEGLRSSITAFLAARPDGIISVKATDKAVYGNLVDVLDEMSILGVPKYAFADLSDGDRALLASKGF